MNNWTVLNKDYVLPILLVSVIHLEEGASVVDGELCDDRNCTKDLAVALDVVAVLLSEDAPDLEAPIYGLVARPHPPLHAKIGDRIAGVIGALDLVGAADVAVVGLDALARLEPVSQGLVEDLDVWPVAGGVWALYPN